SKSVVHVRGMSDGKGSLADNISRTLLSSSARRGLSSMALKIVVQFRQKDGTASITVTPLCLMFSNSAIGSLRSSELAISTCAPCDSGSSSWRRDDENAIEAR